MRYTILVLLLAPLLGGCSLISRGPSADERAQRLNSEKAKAIKLIAAGRYQDALAVLKPLSAEASGDQQLFILIGDAQTALGAYDDAVKSYESAVRAAYNDYETHLKLAVLLFEHGKTGRALTEFDLAVRFGEREAVTHYNYGLTLYRLGGKRASQAVEQLRMAVELDPENAGYAAALGMALSGRDDGAAIASFEKASTLGADDGAFHNNYGLALQRAKRYVPAAAQFALAVERAPKNEEYRRNLAALYMISGDYPRALLVWDDLIAAFGPRWSYSVYRGEALLQLQRYGDAEASVHAALQELESGADGEPTGTDRRPPLDQAYEVLAMSQRGLGDLKGALRSIEKALELVPRNPSYLNNHGVILAENGMIERAKAEWRKVLEIDVGNATARENLSAYER
jgi:Flp pilus assembly protein TadD